VLVTRLQNDVGCLVRAMAVRREQRGNVGKTNFVGQLMAHHLAGLVTGRARRQIVRDRQIG
jgi:hypothetical protein